MTREVCICVPARNEADRLPTLFRALAEQSIAAPIRIALCINNSEDDSGSIARALADASGGRLLLTIVEHVFPPALAHAGSARRAAMDLGVTLLGDDRGVLLSTDADCRPPPTWIAANLSAFDDDVIVGGRILLDEQEDLPPAMLSVRRRFDAYWDRVRAIEDDVDPSPCDPPPRHGDHTGASLGLSVALYQKAGGVPVIPTGEDRALVEAARAAGGRLVHPADVWTRASARTVGRAEGGMAVDMRRWGEAVDSGIAPRVPAFGHWRERALWRKQARVQMPMHDFVAAERALAALPCDMPLPDLVDA